MSENNMSNLLRCLLAVMIIISITSCNTFTIGGSVSGGSSSDVNVGVGVGIEL